MYLTLRLSISNIIGIISISISAIIFMFILNCFFKITPYQELQGLPLMIAPLISPMAVVLFFEKKTGITDMQVRQQ